MSDSAKSDLPPEQYPGQHDDLRDRAERLAAQDRAHAAILPGALRDAFGGEPKTAEGHQLQPVTLGLAAHLERIHSPLLEVVRIMQEVFAKNVKQSDGDSPYPGGEGRDEGELKKVSFEKTFEEINQRVSELKFEEEQIAETVFLFINPPKRVRQLLAKGPAAFREAAMDELGDKLHPAQMAALQRACIQHYVASFATIIQYGSPPAEGDGVVFPAPSPSAVTASAGG